MKIVITEAQYNRLVKREYIKTENPIIDAINHIIDKGEYVDWWALSSDERADFKIEYQVGASALWYEGDNIVGTIYIDITNLIFGSAMDNEWLEAQSMSDITYAAWEHLENMIKEKLKDWLPEINVNIEFVY